MARSLPAMGTAMKEAENNVACLGQEVLVPGWDPGRLDGDEILAQVDPALLIPRKQELVKVQGTASRRITCWQKPGAMKGMTKPSRILLARVCRADAWNEVRSVASRQAIGHSRTWLAHGDEWDKARCS